MERGGSIEKQKKFDNSIVGYNSFSINRMQRF